MTFFPEYEKLDTGLKSLLTIKHLLTMSSGLVWNEGVPYDNPENSEIRMIRSANHVEYVLSQPMEFAPGQVWKYNGGTTQLLAAIIEKTTGKKIEQFAKEYLFQPLGITSFEWIKYDGTDLAAAASGLRLRSRDLLKFGLLYDKKGVWQGKDKQVNPKMGGRIISTTCTTDHGAVRTDTNSGFGKTRSNNKINSICCLYGNGDQKIFFDKTNDLLIVATAGNYKNRDIKNDVYALLKEYVYPALINNK